jgi:nitrous oxide reductase accessory protein NosL
MKKLSCYVLLVLAACNSPKKQAENTENDNCKTCGMHSLPYSKWNVTWKNTNQTQWFCSPRCMFIQIHKTPSLVNPSDSLLVTDYYTQQRIAAQKAFFVIGSDITSPMGHDFVPLQDEKAATDFMTEHKGKQILRFEEVNNEVIKNLGK